ncbi:DUF2589 domain-containing protein [Mucilaginibacter sp. KACC 22773]|uniref:DUF2589 domain-containing protein n=1 Tax=Mucilaginibacter sp. KACC 22773 TaxID=3025671 RepID=UPI0023659FA1|nr:DUF2589 domain-containing protein [Mucilaginibacter sp. KACC 22773]WDF77422.1 DUF2589 domain-containing protein [Mucilaginibacter sp. KACC 22773]
MESNLLSMAQEFSGLPMDALIGGPLNAAANANSAMALTQTKFMLDTCFAKQGDGDKASYKPVLIEMVLSRGVITPGATATDPTTIQSVDTRFTLPMLTIVPLNSLAVQSVDITFEMEVKSSFAEETSEAKSTESKGEGSFEAKIGWGPVSVTIRGSASYDSKDSSTHDTHYQKSNSAKYTVAVHAGQLPLPQGVSTIINAFTKTIEPIQMPAATPPADADKDKGGK